LAGRPEQQPKVGSGRTEVRRRPEGNIDLQGIGEQENTKEGITAVHVHMVDRPPIAVHLTGPISDHLPEVGPTGNAQSKADVGPAVFGSGGRGASQRSTSDASVRARGRDQAVAESRAVLGCEHGGKYSSARGCRPSARQTVTNRQERASRPGLPRLLP